MQADAEPEFLGDPDALWRRLHQRPATATLIALCLLAYVATFAAALASSADPWSTALLSLRSLEGSEDVLIKLGALDLTRVWIDQEWWRVLTSGLLHGSLLHLALNMVALGSIGDWVEHAWGSRRTVLLFIAASVSGCLASLLWCESRLVVGASAGVLGQAGALWVARQFGTPRLQATLAPVSAFRLGILILLCLFIGTVIPGIAQAGHLGGLGMGLIFGALLARTWPRWVQIAGALTITAVFAGLVLLAREPTWRVQYHALLGFRATEADPATAALHFEAALELAPADPVLLNALAYQFAKAGIELDKAEIYVRRALESSPANASYLDTLGWIWCRQGRPTIAEPLLRAAVFLSNEPVPEITEHITICASSAI